MDNSTKLLIGVVIGFVGYMAYKKLKSTQSVTVDTFNQPGMPNILSSDPSQLSEISSDNMMLAGRRY